MRRRRTAKPIRLDQYRPQRVYMWGEGQGVDVNSPR